MRLLWITPVIGPVLGLVSAGRYPPDEVDVLRASSIQKLRQHLEKHPAKGCTLENAAVRREWSVPYTDSPPKTTKADFFVRSDLTLKERQAYHDAVYCLQSKPPISDPAIVPGARSRFDDFLATHINQTMAIHLTVGRFGPHSPALACYGLPGVPQSSPALGCSSLTARPCPTHRQTF